MAAYRHDETFVYKLNFWYTVASPILIYEIKNFIYISRDAHARWSAPGAPSHGACSTVLYVRYTLKGHSTGVQVQSRRYQGKIILLRKWITVRYLFWFVSRAKATSQDRQRINGFERINRGQDLISLNNNLHTVGVCVSLEIASSIDKPNKSLVSYFDIPWGFSSSHIRVEIGGHGVGFNVFSHSI